MANQTTGKKNSLKANFQNKPTGIQGGCPVLDKITIFPVRYALDESPKEKGTNQGPNPIPEDWPWSLISKRSTAGYLPKLNTRSYTLRQVRDGWLYVYCTLDQELHEYEIKDQTFTFKGHNDVENKTKFTPKNDTFASDRPELNQAKKYLEYRATKQLLITYSSVRCTERIKKQLLINATLGKWTRQVDLQFYCANQNVISDHIKPIKDLGKYVADIKADPLQHPQEAAHPLPDFTTTTVSTVKRNGGNTQDLEVKAIVDETAIQGAMPSTESGIFVALDDPMGMIEDLTMNLIGRWGDYSALESERKHKVDIAHQCLQLLDDKEKTQQLQTFVPKRIQADKTQYYSCLKDINDLLEAQGPYHPPRYPYQTIGFTGDSYYDQGNVNTKYEAFRQKWRYAVEQYDPARDEETGYDKEQYTPLETRKTSAKDYVTLSERWENKYRAWYEIKIWRDDVRMSEMLEYLGQYYKDQQRMEEHIKRHEPDLIVWLNRFDDNVESTLYDPADKDQLEGMAEMVEAITRYLSLTDTGKQWIAEQFNNSKTFIGYTNFGYSKEIYQFLNDQIKIIDKKGEQEVVSNPNPNILSGNLPERPGIIASIDQNSLLNRMGEIQGALSLDMVKNNAQFKLLAKPVQKIFENMCELASKTGSQILDRIASSVIGLLNESKLLAYQAAITVTNSGPNGEKVFLTRNQHFKQQMTNWLAEAKQIKQNINTFTDKNAIELEKQKLNKLLADPPAKWYIEVGGSHEKVPALNYRSIYNKLLSAKDNSKLISWVRSNSGSALPLIVSLANIYNVYQISGRLKTEEYTEQLQIQMLSAIGYAGNSVMATWVMPMAENYKVLEGVVGTGKDATIAIFTKAAINEWSASETALIAKAKFLSTSFMAMSVLGAFAAGYEAYGVYKYEWNSSDPMDQYAWTTVKLGSVVAMTASMGLQALGAFLARFFAFGWVALNPWFAVATFVVGIIYLVASTYAKYYTRDGIRLWLHQCTWGRNANKLWQSQGAEGYLKEYHALYKIIVSPAVYVHGLSSTTNTPGGVVYKAADIGISIQHVDSLWLGIMLPEQLAGKEITIDVLLVETRPNTPIKRGKDYYQQIKNHSYWSTLPAKDQPFKLPNTPLKTIQPDTNYTSKDSARLLMTWIETKDILSSLIKANEVQKFMTVELKITYPYSAFFYTEDNPNLDASYTFRLEVDAYKDTIAAKLVTDDYGIKGLPKDLLLGNTVSNNYPQPFWVPTLTGK